MKNFDLNALGVKEMNHHEMVETNGGDKIPYYEYTWSGTDNPIIYTGEAIVNGGKIVANGVIAVINWFRS